MNARQKLNLAYLNGSMLLAGIIAYALGSWPVFIVGAALVIAAHVVLGCIRPRRR